MKKTCIALVISTCLLLPSISIAEKRIYDDKSKYVGTIREGRIYDSSSCYRGTIRDDKVYDSKSQYRGRVEKSRDRKKSHKHYEEDSDD